MGSSITPSNDPTGSFVTSTDSTDPVVSGTHRGLTEVDPWADSINKTQVEHSPVSLSKLAETIEVIALALLMFVTVRFVAQNFIVDGRSMEPNFHQGDLLIVNRLAYRSFDISWIPWNDNDSWEPFGNPTRGDVVVFRFSEDPERDFLKRVVATEGQTVELRDGVVYVDRIAIKEPYISTIPIYNLKPELIPEGKLFVLGDNRNNSYDSRTWGMLDRKALIGRADVRYWPPRRTELIEHYRPEHSEVGPSTHTNVSTGSLSAVSSFQ